MVAFLERETVLFRAPLVKDRNLYTPANMEKCTGPFSEVFQKGSNLRHVWKATFWAAFKGIPNGCVLW